MDARPVVPDGVEVFGEPLPQQTDDRCSARCSAASRGAVARQATTRAYSEWDDVESAAIMLRWWTREATHSPPSAESVPRTGVRHPGPDRWEDAAPIVEVQVSAGTRSGPASLLLASRSSTPVCAPVGRPF